MPPELTSISSSDAILSGFFISVQIGRGCCLVRLKKRAEQELLAAAPGGEDEDEEEESEYETDSEEEDGFGRAMLKPVFVPKVRRWFLPAPRVHPDPDKLQLGAYWCCWLMLRIAGAHAVSKPGKQWAAQQKPRIKPRYRTLKPSKPYRIAYANKGNVMLRRSGTRLRSARRESARRRRRPRGNARAWSSASSSRAPSLWTRSRARRPPRAPLQRCALSGLPCGCSRAPSSALACPVTRPSASCNVHPMPYNATVNVPLSCPSMLMPMRLSALELHATPLCQC